MATLFDIISARNATSVAHRVCPGQDADTLFNGNVCHPLDEMSRIRLDRTRPECQMLANTAFWGIAGGPVAFLIPP